MPSATTSSRGSFSGELQRASEELWDELKGHPFVVEMAAGTLPMQKFLHYIEQNLLYLPQYARAIALGAAKSRNEKELHYFAGSLTNILEVEIPQNLLLWERVRGLVGSTEPRATEMAPGALSYTSYLLATAGVGTPVEILALIMPCAWSYGDIGLALEPTKVEHEVYSDWIAFFATEEYSELVTTMRATFDAYAADLGPDERARIADIFHTAIRLEKGFWDMGYELQTWSDKRH